MEILVVIGVVGVLIAISAPALRSARDSSRELVCVSNLRGIGQTIEHYARANSRRHPFAPPSAAGADPLDLPMYPASPEGDGSILVSMEPWAVSLQWPLLMHSVAPWREHFASWVCPGAVRGAGGPWESVETAPGVNGPITSYLYSTSFIAAPALWSGNAPADTSLLRPTLVSEVAHPSNKVVFWDGEMAHLSVRDQARRDQRPMLFADGHAATMRLSESSEPVRNPFTGAARRLADTRLGVDGRDC